MQTETENIYNAYKVSGMYHTRILYNKSLDIKSDLTNNLNMQYKDAKIHLIP